MTTTKTYRGLAQVEQAFIQAKAEQRAAFIPYFPVGYPDYRTSVEILADLAHAGADIIELGVPFSDPLADGPINQAASYIALKNGTTLKHCFQAVDELRQRGIQTPIVMMGYLNPFLAYNVDELVKQAQLSGVDGFIIPDMPVDEADIIQPEIENAGLALPHFLAPTSKPARIELVAEKSRGYIYLVSVAGVTGVRTSLPTDLIERIKAIREVTTTPIAIGFGISTPEQAAEVGKMVDGVIVGSALVKAGGEQVVQAGELAKSLRKALNP